MKKISGVANDNSNQLSESAIAVITRQRNVTVRAAAFVTKDGGTLNADAVKGTLKVGQNTYTIAFVPIIPGGQSNTGGKTDLAVDFIGINDECTIYAGMVAPSQVDGGNLSLTFEGASATISVMWDVLYA